MFVHGLVDLEIGCFFMKKKRRISNLQNVILPVDMEIACPKKTKVTMENIRK